VDGDAEGASLVWYLAGGSLAVLAVAALFQLQRWAMGRGDRLLDAQVRDAFRSGDLRRAGDLQASRGRFAEAARLYGQGREWARQARALEKTGEREQAAEAHERAGEHAAAAKIYEDLGDSARAALCLQKVATSPDSQRAAAAHFARSGQHLEAGRLYQQIGEFEKAADEFSQVRDLDPPDAVVTMLENAVLAMEDDDPRRAGLLARVADVAFKLGQHDRAARAYDGAGQPKRAAELYERALRRFDLAAALYAEAGDEASVARLTAQAGGEVAVLRARESRARERGEDAMAQTLRERIHELEPRNAALPVPDEVPAPKPRSAAKTSTAGAPRYELVSELGRGGMGIVHRAKDRLLGREVALKFMPADEADGPLLQMFRREARAAAALSHPGIVTIFDIGRLDGREFIAMELVDGVPLDRLLAERGGKLSLLQGLEVAEATLEALSYAHGQRVIHRDLKPANLMKQRNGGIKVMDFGLAKQMGATTGNHQTVIAGTPAYMPPEQRLGVTDARSDLFALGATLYEIFTGRLPGSEHEPASSATGYPTARDREPLVPERLSALLARCLAHDPAARPASAAEVLREVRAIKQGIVDALRSLDSVPPAAARAAAPARAISTQAHTAPALRPEPAPAPAPTAAARPEPGERRPKGPGVHVHRGEAPSPDVVFGGKRPKP
jgi:tetratricopeptide (TPR) repeat protein